MSQSGAVRPGPAIRTLNPATGELLREFSPTPEAQIEAALNGALEAFALARACPVSLRVHRLQAVADLLDHEQERYARLMSLEMGKPIRAARQEVAKCALGCRYYAEHGPRFTAPEQLPGGPPAAAVHYQPLGPILAVMPWNFPFWQVIRFAAPAMIAGNVAVLKHASNVPQCALALQEIFERSGFPKGSFQSLLIGGSRAEKLIADPRIAAVTLTGSVEAGRAVAAAAGRALKKTVLELGGSDPFIVMPSADLDRAAEVGVQARTVNNGQSCIAAKRFIVAREIFEPFCRAFVRRMQALRVGEPLSEETDVGPLATQDVLNSLEDQVRDTLQAGAHALLPGGRLEGRGYYYAPAVLTQIPAGSPADRDELFGPVASIYPADDIEHAVSRANDTVFGLGAALWSNDPAEQQFFIGNIQSGMAVINGMVASEPRAPFGGVKCSGYGRELSRQGILEFMNAKTVMGGVNPLGKTE